MAYLHNDAEENSRHLFLCSTKILKLGKVESKPCQLLIWQKISFFNPILYLVNSFRYGFLGISDISVSVAVISMGVLIGIMWCVALFLLHRGIGLRQ